MSRSMFYGSGYSQRYLAYFRSGWTKKKKSVTLPGTKTELTMENKGEIILYRPDNEVKLEVRLEDETVWLNRQQLSVLFDRDIKTIGKHVNNALKEELAGMATVANFATVQKEGDRIITRQIEYYNLDMILSIGYRVKSSRQLQLDLQKHNSQYPPIEVHVCKKCHDRFIIIDGAEADCKSAATGSAEVWHIGASLKDLGKKMFAFSKLSIPASAVTSLL